MSATMSPRALLFPLTRLWASSFRSYPSCAAILLIRSLVSSRISGELFRALETVEGETPAALAMSFMVTAIFSKGLSPFEIVVKKEGPVGDKIPSRKEVEMAYVTKKELIEKVKPLLEDLGRSLEELEASLDTFRETLERINDAIAEAEEE